MKLKQEKEKKDEEERIRLRKEENEKLFNEFEIKKKDEEEKKLLKETLKKKKEEELKNKRQVELNTFSDKNNKKNIVFDDTLSDSSSINNIQKTYTKKNKNKKDKMNVQQKKRISGPKLYEFYKFRKPDTPRTESESSEDKEIIIMKKENKNKLNKSAIELKKPRLASYISFM